RKPDRTEIGLDREVEAQASRARAAVVEGVLDHHALPAVRTELEALDLQAVQDGAVAEPIAVRIIDELDGAGEGRLPMRRGIGDRGPEAVHQLDRVQPQPTHLAGYVAAQVREVPILRA